jgi:hypothetical protein
MMARNIFPVQGGGPNYLFGPCQSIEKMINHTIICEKIYFFLIVIYDLTASKLNFLELKVMSVNFSKLLSPC